MIAKTKAIEEENRRLKKMFAELSMQNELLKEALRKSNRAISTLRDGRDGGDATSGQHCSGLPCLWVSETCYRYSPKLRDENEEIADLLVGLTEARKTWGFGLCFLLLRNVQGHLWNKRVCRIYCELELNLRIKPREAVEAGQTRRIGGARGPQSDLVHGLHG